MKRVAARVLQVFARNPRPGEVKTRLIPALGAVAAAAVYRHLLCHTLATASRLRLDRRELWTDLPPDDGLAQLAAQHGFSCRLQHGDDLGARMQHALSDAWRSGAHAVLIGSDCPQYSTAYLERAFDALLAHDAVLGPAADGGYVLIGGTRPLPGAFDAIPWGSDAVLALTRRALERARVRRLELQVLRDVDLPTDLAHFPALRGVAEQALKQAALTGRLCE